MSLVYGYKVDKILNKNITSTGLASSNLVDTCKNGGNQLQPRFLFDRNQLSPLAARKSQRFRMPEKNSRQAKPLQQQARTRNTSRESHLESNEGPCTVRDSASKPSIIILLRLIRLLQYSVEIFSTAPCKSMLNRLRKL